MDKEEQLKELIKFYHAYRFTCDYKKQIEYKNLISILLNDKDLLIDKSTLEQAKTITILK